MAAAQRQAVKLPQLLHLRLLALSCDCVANEPGRATRMSNTATRVTRAADKAARDLARGLMGESRFASLGVIDAVTLTPALSRIAFGLDAQGAPLSLISSISAHHAHLTANPSCALMVGEPGPKGDPLTAPRLMLQARARLLNREDPDHPALRQQWLAAHPKSRLYIDFADFIFVRFDVVAAFLNGGFGKAFHLTPADLFPPA
jgi:heme iron utilization protein